MGEKPEFIILVETRLSCGIEEREIMLENYNYYATISNSTRVEGLRVYFEKGGRLKNYEKIIESKIWISAYEARYKNYGFVALQNLNLS